MLHIHIQDGEVGTALDSLSKEDRQYIKPDLALRAFNLTLNKLPRVGKCGAVRYTISELYIGTQGERKRRQKVFRAYWRLLVKILNNREHPVRASADKRGKRRVI